MSASSLKYGPVHCNSNVICAMSIRAGGSDPSSCDLLEIALLPLDHSYRPHKEFQLFHARIRPSWPVDTKYAKLSKPALEEYKKSPFDGIGAFNLFEHWIASLGLKTHKKIMPLVWDWASIKPYLQMWAGQSNFEYYFSDVVRDLLPVMAFINDRTDFWGEPIKYPHYRLSQLAVRENIEQIERNSVLSDVKALVDTNVQLLRNYIPGYAKVK